MSYWQPIDTAPKDNDVDVLVYYDHDADPYQDPDNPDRLTDYAAIAEGCDDFLSGAGVCVARWFPRQWEATDEYGGGYYLPEGWFAAENDDYMRVVNATHWMSLPEPPTT